MSDWLQNTKSPDVKRKSPEIREKLHISKFKWCENGIQRRLELQMVWSTLKLDTHCSVKATICLITRYFIQSTNQLKDTTEVASLRVVTR
jgi:hypothetical protein